MFGLLAALATTLQSTDDGRVSSAPSFRLVQELIVPTLAYRDEFGSAVAIDGDRLAVSAPRRQAPGPSAARGAVFVFERGN